jgi:hypothetical protein
VVARQICRARRGRDARPRRKTERDSLSPRELERKAPRSVWATQLPASRPIRWIVRESREANRTDFARIPSDGLRDAPRASIERTRPLFIGQTSLALPHVNRTDSHSESPRPLSQGRISPAFGRPTPIQPFPNPDMDGINRHSTTTQPSFVSNPR